MKELSLYLLDKRVIEIKDIVSEIKSVDKLNVYTYDTLNNSDIIVGYLLGFKNKTGYKDEIYLTYIDIEGKSNDNIVTVAKANNADKLNNKDINYILNYNNLTNRPISIKNPYSLTIKGNGNTLTNGIYDGSVSKTVNITPSSIGAANSTHIHNDVTTSTSGFMSASDKIKLNGISPNANNTIVDTVLSTMSTNPVQNKIITNALNNKANKEHIHNIILENVSLNNITDVGFYTVKNLIDGPSEVDYASLIVLKSDTDEKNSYYNIHQIIINDEVSNMYIRNYNGGTWSDWTKINNGDADTVDGKHASDFALNNHNHDNKYLTAIDDSGNRVVTDTVDFRGDINVESDLNAWSINVNSYEGFDGEIYAAGKITTNTGFYGDGSNITNVNAKTLNGKNIDYLLNYNNFTNKPTSMKNPCSLTIQFDGTSQGSYNGETTKTININPLAIGAANKNHTHDKYIENVYNSNNLESTVTMYRGQEIQSYITYNYFSNLKFNKTGDIIYEYGYDYEENDPEQPYDSGTESNTKKISFEGHSHKKADITDFPISLPANGGNADTVDGKHSKDFFSVNGGIVNGNIETTGNISLTNTISIKNFSTSSEQYLRIANWRYTGYNKFIWEILNSSDGNAYKTLMEYDTNKSFMQVGLDLSINGSVTAKNFYGDGSNITNVDSKGLNVYMFNTIPNADNITDCLIAYRDGNCVKLLSTRADAADYVTVAYANTANKIKNSLGINLITHNSFGTGSESHIFDGSENITVNITADSIGALEIINANNPSKNINYNNYINTHLYTHIRKDSTTNSPNNNTASCSLFVCSIDDTNVIQLAFSNNNTNNGHLYIRQGVKTTKEFGEWKEIAYTDVATTTTNGLMSAADKAKLDSNTIPQINVRNTDFNNLVGKTCIYNLACDSDKTMTNTPNGVANWGHVMALEGNSKTVQIYVPDSGNDIYIRSLRNDNNNLVSDWSSLKQGVSRNFNFVASKQGYYRFAIGASCGYNNNACGIMTIILEYTNHKSNAIVSISQTGQYGNFAILSSTTSNTLNNKYRMVQDNTDKYMYFEILVGSDDAQHKDISVGDVSITFIFHGIGWNACNEVSYTDNNSSNTVICSKVV